MWLSNIGTSLQKSSETRMRQHCLLFVGISATAFVVLCPSGDEPLFVRKSSAGMTLLRQLPAERSYKDAFFNSSNKPLCVENIDDCGCFVLHGQDGALFATKMHKRTTRLCVPYCDVR
eukprot:TRINITY_DN61931_c0_g1_i1.p4 TRINITY_DN61931_c0_g1~~TRINITY_DN61931_c0_g1_i1.p4  ORF type:complete len:118 (-),score=8.01 TRINITY_DN61931_c0_g1_i1:537-890(-)